MDLHKAEQLLEKYWQCETSLEEEQALREFFRQRGAPASMKAPADLFQFFETEKEKSLDNNFERTVTKKLSTRRRGKIVSMVSFGNIARIAAGIAVLVAATLFIRQEIRKSYPQELQDTYSDPKMAFEETKRALEMISNSFGVAKKEASKIQLLNEAEKKIQKKPVEEKISI